MSSQQYPKWVEEFLWSYLLEKSDEINKQFGIEPDSQEQANIDVGLWGVVPAQQNVKTMLIDTGEQEQ